ncbi:MAG: hypothetical protein Q7O66_00125 [Dehalococcoidia bacterium]|nr:hypothetical protein [Dehalococcoidia bacterium]
MGILVLDRDEAERLRSSINGDPEFRLAARYMTMNLAMDFGGYKRLFKVREGELEEIGPATIMGDPVDVYIRGTTEFWEKLLQPVPPAGFQNVMAGLKSRSSEVIGNFELYHAYAWAINRLIGVMRDRQNSIV